MSLKPHPILPPPGLAEVQGEMQVGKCDAETALLRLLKKRDTVVSAEEFDPLQCGWEPSIWLIPRVLLDWKWCHKEWENEIRRRLNMSWTEFKKAMLQRLGFKEPVKLVLLLGGNRSGKSELEAKMAMEMIANEPKSTTAAMHMSMPRSINEQQTLFWKYMPPDWRRQMQTSKEYIKYKLKTGFADASFITPILSQARFLCYAQDMDTALQGLELDFATPDELIPPDWVENLVLRLSTRAGKGLIGFTPVHGYTPSVQIFLEGATVAMERLAALCPMDGKDRDEALALGLTAEEHAELMAAAREKRTPLAPQARPEDVLGWLSKPAEGAADGKGDLAVARTFEMLPRVLRCRDPRKAVVFFWSSDNPYGNPKEVAADLRVKTLSGIGGVKERFYGLPDRVAHGKFPKFARRVHVVPATAIPEKGLNYLFADPASGRNFFLTWVRVCSGRAYVYREWPGNYWIPEIGVPGPWTIPSGRKEGLNDGARGDGQGPWGFGTIRMKFEVARLEGWAAWREWKESGKQGDENRLPSSEEIDGWEEGLNDTEPMEGRYIDSRAATNPRMERDRPVTLQTDFARIGLEFDLTPGDDVTEGVQRLNTLFDYQADPLNALGTNWATAPRFYVSAECENTIYAIENWKNADGDKGACKDPIDNLRYFVDLGLADQDRTDRTRGGFAYGHANERNNARWRRGGRTLPPATIGGKACRI